MDSHHEKYLNLANATIGLKEKNVFEIGGSVPPRQLLAYGPKSWKCANLDVVSVDAFNDEAKKLGLPNYVARVQNIATEQEAGKFDVIYSINCFEHVLDLKGGLGKMFEALRDGGYLFTIFGPIWSSDVGHHLSIDGEKGPLIFSDGVLGPWEHLTSTPEGIRQRLEPIYGKKTADRAIEYIYYYPDLNRLCESQYLDLVAASGFSTVLLLRRKSGKAPNINGASSTREFLMVLKKGRTSMLERLLVFLRFSTAFLKTTLR